jgi:hypothetical protein
MEIGVETLTGAYNDPLRLLLQMRAKPQSKAYVKFVRRRNAVSRGLIDAAPTSGDYCSRLLNEAEADHPVPQVLHNEIAAEAGE